LLEARGDSLQRIDDPVLQALLQKGVVNRILLLIVEIVDDREEY